MIRIENDPEPKFPRWAAWTCLAIAVGGIVGCLFFAV
jgi:hypothetical protein